MNSKKLRQIFAGILLLLLLVILSGCGLISAKPSQSPNAQTPIETLETTENQSSEISKVSADVAGINKLASSEDNLLANVAVRFFSLEQVSDMQPDALHGYYWLDGVVQRVHYSNGAVNVVEVESAYDGERYVVVANLELLEDLSQGQFVYLNGFYDTFSGFRALEYYNTNELLEEVVQTSVSRPVVGNVAIAVEKLYDFGQVVEVNKRRQKILLENKSSSNDETKLNEIVLNNETTFFDAFSKEVITKSAFWRTLSKDDVVYSLTQDNKQTIWLVDKQSTNRTVIGTVKQVNKAQTEIVLASELWLLNDGEISKQDSEVIVKLDRKSQVVSKDGQLINDSASRTSTFVLGQQLVVEGIQKNRFLNAEKLHLKDKKDLPVYVYGTVKRHKEDNKTIDLTVEWMFGSDPSTTVEVVINSFTELFEMDDKDTSLDAFEFWDLVSLSDDVEVEGYMLGDTLQANRLFLGNKEIEVQTLSGTVDVVNAFPDGLIALRLYSFSEDTLTNDRSMFQVSLPKAVRKDVIDIRLANNVDVQDIYGAESLLVAEFWSRLEPTDNLTVTGYFENDIFVATKVAFEDKDTTPFVFGAVEAFDATNKQIMLNGKNQVIVLTRATSIKDSKLARLSAKTFWSELTPGDYIDIKGSYQDDVFFATEIFLSSVNQELHELQENPDKKDSFNLFNWLMN